MAVLAADLKQPTGRLPATWFADASLTAWIAEGEAKAASITDATAQDAAVTAWAYHRAYDAKAQEKEDLPVSRQFGSKVDSFGASRSEYWRDEAQRWLSEFNDYVAGTQDSVPSFLFGRAAGRRGR